MTAFTFNIDRSLRLTACCLALGLFSGNAYATCNFQTGATYMTYALDMKTFWVPRDAPDGTVIGNYPMDEFNREGASVLCNPDTLNPPRARLTNTAPIFSGTLPPLGGKNINGRILETNIPGIGVYMELGWPFDGRAGNSFAPDPGTSPVIPYSGTLQTQPYNVVVSLIRGNAWLIKTGPIAPGSHDVNSTVFHGQLHNLGEVLEYGITAKVYQAQCSLNSNSVSQGLVNLGNYTPADFTGANPATPPVPFQITLNECKDPSSNPANVYIELDGANGSVPTVPAEGRFSLGGASDAAGVEIQLLRSDGSPMPLQSEEMVKPISVGTTHLDFQARYYKSAPVITPGLAEGGLTFTVSYK